MDVNDLRHQLQETPYDFLAAVSSSTLHKFDTEWQSLCEDVNNASHQSLLNDEDHSLVHATATLLVTMGELLWKTEEETVKRTASFVEEVEDVFSRLTIDDIGHASSVPSANRRVSRSYGTSPSYIPAAYSWILQNIHDPYPSNEVKERISRDAGRPLRIVTDWFKDVRRCIGWVAMCKNYFQGSRAHAVQVAKHVYLENESTSPPSAPHIVAQFEAIRARLRDMYPMADDGGDLSDSTDDSFTSSLLPSRRFISGQSPYARSSSSTPSLVFSSDDEDNLSQSSVSHNAPVILGKRKSAAGDDELRVLKRNRSGFIRVPDGELPTGSTGLSPLQPTSSRKRRFSAAEDRENVTSKHPTLASNTDTHLPLRIPKRRLSVSDSQPTPKRHCLPPAVGPRKQAVSTPIPIAHQTTSDIDDWFRTFELPDTSLSVELFSDWDVTVENDVFPYDSLYDGSLQSDSPDPLNVTLLSDTYLLSTSLDLGVSSAIDPSILDISSAFTESPAPIFSHSSEPITATASPAFDLLHAFLSTVNAESAEPQSTQPSLSPYAELSLDDSIDIFGDLVDP